MDFIIGLLLFIVVIFIIINFTSISMSNTKAGGTCSSSTSILGTNQYQNQYGYGNSNIPSPVYSKDSLALNNKLNINNQTYDYNKYFFL